MYQQDYMQTNIYINLRTLVASTKSENPISEFEREVSNVRIVGAVSISTLTVENCELTYSSETNLARRSSLGKESDHLPTVRQQLLV